jgi:hypothetical protein
MKDNDIMGEMEFFLSRDKKRQITVICKSEYAEVYFLSNENLLKVLNPPLIEKFIILAKKKSGLLSGRYKNGRDLHQSLASTKVSIVPTINNGKIQVSSEKVEDVLYSYKKVNPLPHFHGYSDSKSYREKGFNNIANSKMMLDSMNSLNGNFLNCSLKTENALFSQIIGNTSNLTKSENTSPATKFLDRITQNNYLKTYNTCRELKSLQTKAVTKSYVIQDKLDQSFSFKALLNVTTYPNLKTSHENFSSKTSSDMNSSVNKLKELNSSLLEFSKTGQPRKKYNGGMIPSSRKDL